MNEQLDLQGIGKAVVQHLAATGGEVADLSLADLAAIAGISRATLIRRIGSRGALDEVLAAAGVESVRRRSVAERAVEAAAGLYAERGVAEVTLDAVAASAGCTVQAIHGGLGGREGLLVAVFERYSPLPGMALVLADLPDDIYEAARMLYNEVLGALLGNPPVLPALIAEVSSRPSGALAAHVRDSYGPRTAGLVEDWLARHRARGTVRPLSISSVMSLFAGPALFQASFVSVTGRVPSPQERARLANDLAASFSRAIAP
ncbi:hypothetical protein AQ490_23715 [Wenjunlia vitaminophila]|uniref:HTH tetR-type domain-containing protein n=1 Tax=Wenjunlia vitaminophila TaxID=76728 RepID=A0A0T6LSR0_WENVI|nr:TetR family transcriptional regulator [Wenjunlia vitaminophila]KRV48866.1 hypothetical protein AQ490_23715 [Wenjunlia vitaminophila]